MICFARDNGDSMITEFSDMSCSGDATDSVADDDYMHSIYFNSIHVERWPSFRDIGRLRTTCIVLADYSKFGFNLLI